MREIKGWDLLEPTSFFVVNTAWGKKGRKLE